MQPNLQPGQDPGELEADMADAEDRDRRPHPEGFQQQPDFSTAALPTVLVPGVRVQLGLDHLGSAGAAGDQLPCAAYRSLLQVPPADAAPGLGRSDKHLCARIAWRVSAY